MLFYGEYAIAENYNQYIEVIHRFMEDDGCSTLLIIDSEERVTYFRDLCKTETIECSVELLTSGISEGEKNIFIYHSWNSVAKEFVKNKWAALLFS